MTEIWRACDDGLPNREEVPMILVDAQPMTLPEVLAYLRARYGVSEGPILSSERM